MEWIVDMEVFSNITNFELMLAMLEKSVGRED